MQTKKEKKEYDRKYYLLHQEKNKARASKFQKENREWCNKRMRIRNAKRRIEILNVISGNNPVCVRCGCDDVRLLEINHKDGGGTQELRHGKKVWRFLDDILKGRRKTDDLELLCRVCNAEHYLELKYGELPYTISYKKEGD